MGSPKATSEEMITMIETCELVECEIRLIHPIGICEVTYLNKEHLVYIEIETLQELKTIAENLKKPLLYDAHHYIVIFDDIHYRTKKIDQIHQKYDL